MISNKGGRCNLIPAPHSCWEIVAGCRGPSGGPGYPARKRFNLYHIKCHDKAGPGLRAYAIQFSRRRWPEPNKCQLDLMFDMVRFILYKGSFKI